MSGDTIQEEIVPLEYVEKAVTNDRLQYAVDDARFAIADAIKHQEKAVIKFMKLLMTIDELSASISSVKMINREGQEKILVFTSVTTMPADLSKCKFVDSQGRVSSFLFTQMLTAVLFMQACTQACTPTTHWTLYIHKL